MRTVAALFVDPRGIYPTLTDVDPWDEARDARLYVGPHPVVAHPPCGRWVMPLAKVNETRYGHKVGDDGGCFAAALDSVRRWGGVLEHPSTTTAFRHYGIDKPRGRQWQRTSCGGHVCVVAQSAYGHPAHKLTWLYAYGIDPIPLDWGDGVVTATVSWLPNTKIKRARISKRAASATPLAFAKVLLRMARTAR